MLNGKIKVQQNQLPDSFIAGQAEQPYSQAGIQLPTEDGIVSDQRI